MKKVVFLISIVCLAIIVGFYINARPNKTKNRAEEAKEISLKYLNEKYDDEFVAKGYQNSNWAYNYEVVTFYSKKYNDNVTTHIYTNNNVKTVKDDYFNLYLYEEACKYFKKIISVDNIKYSVKVRFNDDFLPDDIDGKITFDNYLRLNRSIIEVFYFIEEDLEKIDENIFLDPFIKNELKEWVSIIQVNDLEKIKKEKIDNLLGGTSTESIIGKKYKIRDDFSIENRVLQFYREDK